MHLNLSAPPFRPGLGLLSLCVWVAGVATGTPAWAYKVERVCETTEATGKKPATKVCKTLLVKPGADNKDAKKEEKKEEKPAAGHH